MKNRINSAHSISLTRRLLGIIAESMLNSRRSQPRATPVRMAVGPALLIVFIFISAVGVARTNPVPFVNNPLVPTSVAPGGAQFTLTVNGTGFVSGATVNWNRAALTTTFVSSSRLTATVPAAKIATAGTASITVTNPAPGGGKSDVLYFSITNARATVSFVQSSTVPDLLAYDITTADFNVVTARPISQRWGPACLTSIVGSPCSWAMVTGRSDNPSSLLTRQAVLMSAWNKQTSSLQATFMAMGDSILWRAMRGTLAAIRPPI